MLIISNLTYKIDNINTIFKNISFSIKDNEKVAIVGKNGIGKSVLLQLILGKIKYDNGKIVKDSLNIGYFPQKFNELNFSSVSDVFGLEKQVISLNKVNNDSADIEDYENLDGNWDCIEKIKNQMKFFNLNFDLLRDFSSLSGGEKVKLILSSIINDKTNFLILDEPTNNMDYISKKYFYDFIKSWKGGLLVVSHDRELLNLTEKIIELRNIGMKDTKIFSYGGNYEYYLGQKKLEENSLQNTLNNSLKKTENIKNQIIKNIKNILTKEKQGQKALNKSKYDKAGFGLKISQAEKSEGKITKKLDKNLNEINNEIKNIKLKIEVKTNIYFKFEETKFKNKNLIEINNLNFFYGCKQIFNDFNLLVKTADRIAINGKNGSGKSTLLKIIASKINDYKGSIKINSNNLVYLDQDCNFLDKNKSILENILSINNIKEKDARDILAMFLFRTDEVYKKVSSLSGGEKLRVALSCIFANKTPEIILLDEPTNNIDLESIKVLENILNQYNGTIIVVSHDKIFKENININKTIILDELKKNI